MKIPVDIEKKPPKVFLAGIKDQKTGKKESESLIKELASLSETLGAEIIGREIVNIRENNAQYGMGTGKPRKSRKKPLRLGRNV